jgi:hypothetical protein
MKALLKVEANTSIGLTSHSAKLGKHMLGKIGRLYHVVWLDFKGERYKNY